MQLKIAAVSGLLILLLAACQNRQKANEQPAPFDPQPEVVVEGEGNYFPVTNVILGSIKEIKDMYVDPLKYTTIGPKTDSVWIKPGEIDAAFSEFVNPVIDTANLKEFYSESKFLDQSVDAFTFMYEPRQELPDSMKWLSWVAYVNTETGKVRRIDMTKKGEHEGEIKHLLWNPGEGYSKVTEMKQGSGTINVINKITLIKWRL